MTKKPNTPATGVPHTVTKKETSKVAAKRASTRDSANGKYMGLIVGKDPTKTSPGTGGTGVKAKAGKGAS